MKLKKERLGNGLDVIVQKTNASSITILFACNVGSNDEKINGTTHFLEHMFFEGTQNYPTAFELNETIDKIGGDMNAMTGKNRTVYFIRVHKQFFKLALSVLSDMILRPLFLPSAFEKEKQVIIHEITHTLDDPKQRLWIEFDKFLFVKHPAKRPIGGTVSSVSKIKLSDLESHYKKYYTAKNSCLVLVGNIAKNHLIECEKAFGGLSAGFENKRSFAQEQNAKKSKRVKMNLQQMYYICGYHVPSNHKDGAVFDVIESILSKGQTGWLVDEFRLKRGIAYDIRSQHEEEPTGSVFSLSVVTSQKHLELVRSKMTELLLRLQSVDAQTVENAKNYLLGKYALLYDESVYLANYLADIHFDKQESFETRIKKVTMSDVRRVAKSFDQKSELILN
jgi:predicted Zn-dependent peptidase